MITEEHKVGDVLIVPGLIQDPNAGSFEEFQITVEEVQTDKFVDSILVSLSSLMISHHNSMDLGRSLL